MWYPGWHLSHLSPITPGLHTHRPLLSHWVLREPVDEGFSFFILAFGWVLVTCKLLSLHLVSQSNIMLFSYRQGCSCRTDSADRMHPCSSFPGISRSSAHLCCLCSSCSDHRDPWHDTAPHRSNIRHSCRYSYRLKERHTPTVTMSKLPEEGFNSASDADITFTRVINAQSLEWWNWCSKHYAKVKPLLEQVSGQTFMRVEKREKRSRCVRKLSCWTHQMWRLVMHFQEVRTRQDPFIHNVIST